MTSINEQLDQWPPLRPAGTNIKGWVLNCQRTGLIVVPIHEHVTGWDCVVIMGNDTYPRGGYNIFVSDKELQRALAVEL